MKLTKKILNTLLLLISLSFIHGCGGDGIGGTGVEPGVNSPALLTTITRVTIPFREHGYSNFETIVFHNQNEFDAFISDVNGQASWNEKTQFLQQIQAETIDFSKQNLFIYRITETSGSNVLTPKPPILTNNKITVNIDRQVPNVGTADIANYGLAYKVNKSITKVIFDNGTSQVTVDLTETPTITTQGKLIRSNSDDLLTYFQESIKRDYTNPNQGIEDTGLVFSVAPPAADAGSNSGVSSTNIQELGVDEADLIKTDGRYIYSVKKGSAITDTSSIPVDAPQGLSSLPVNNPQSSDVIRILDTQDSTGLSEIMNLKDEDNPWSIAGLYLHESQKRIIALSSTKQNYYPEWFNSSYFANTDTDVMFVDVDDPNAASITTKLSFEGQLIDSRRNGNTLYLVLRNYPNYQYVDDETLATSSNIDFLPRYTVGDSASQLLTPPEDCFVEEDQQGSADIITLVAVNLTSTTPQIKSHCYVGSAEAIYASQNALYLATTRWNYQTTNGIAVYDNEITTDIHKFAYDGLDFDYRGSGEVDGHLGFRQGSKSFRFSEYNGLLRVVTFDEDQWNFLPILVQPALEEPTNQSTTPAERKSPVVVSVLRDDPSSRSLQLVSKLPNANRPAAIGLPGEQLYASRFIGNRAYLITFRVIDPLYVIDLSNPEDLLIAGELKIDGYSEYLHPVSENLLLGVGKDAIPDTSGATGNDGRGAWYQGVKLSLLDVSDPANPREADKMILGKRGTDATALYTHHGLTGLKVNDSYRVAIPMRLHDQTSQSSNSITPSTFYEYTQTGLYRFEIDINNQTIEQKNALVVATSSEQTSRNIYDDRSVIINNDVLYMHNGDFWKQDWQGNNTVIGPE